MSLRTFAKKALPWIALAVAVACLGYTWNRALAKATERHRTHNAFVAGTSKYIFNLCPSTSLKDDVPAWVSDMRGLCQARQPTWGTAEQGATGANLNIETGSRWEALQLISKLALEITPGKVLSLLTLVVISLAGILGLQQQGWMSRQGINPRLRVTRGIAVSMLVIVVMALSASLLLFDAQETMTMCQMTGNTYANLLSVDARCSQQTTLLRDTQAQLEQKKGELDSRARELEDLKREIASLSAMRDALGTFKTELKTQSESTQQLLMAVTGATLESISKTVDPLHKQVQGLDQTLKTDFKNDLRGELQGDMKSLVHGELKAALQGEELRELVRREVRAAVQEDVRAVMRDELRDSMKTVLAATHAPAPAASPEPVPVKSEPAKVEPAKVEPAKVEKAPIPAPIPVQTARAPAFVPTRTAAPQPAHPAVQKSVATGAQAKATAPTKTLAPRNGAGGSVPVKATAPAAKPPAPAPLKH
jgi:hypothetical protein